MKYLRLSIFALIFLVLISSLTFAFDDKRTHKKLSELAINNSQLISYLPDQLQIKNTKAELKSGGEKRRIIEWVEEGSYEEDQPSCRASNHFHNPLKPWDQAMLTDPIWIVGRVCDVLSPFKEKYSNLVWATGYESPAVSLDPPVNNDPTVNNGRNWSVARSFFYQALTHEDPVKREV